MLGFAIGSPVRARGPLTSPPISLPPAPPVRAETAALLARMTALLMMPAPIAPVMPPVPSAANRSTWRSTIQTAVMSIASPVTMPSRRQRFGPGESRVMKSLTMKQASSPTNIEPAGKRYSCPEYLREFNTSTEAFWEAVGG